MWYMLASLMRPAKLVKSPPTSPTPKIAVEGTDDDELQIENTTKVDFDVFHKSVETKAIFRQFEYDLFVVALSSIALINLVVMGLAKKEIVQLFSGFLAVVGAYNVATSVYRMVSTIVGVKKGT